MYNFLAFFILEKAIRTVRRENFWKNFSRKKTANQEGLFIPGSSF